MERTDPKIYMMDTNHTLSNNSTLVDDNTKLLTRDGSRLGTTGKDMITDLRVDMKEKEISLSRKAVVLKVTSSVRPHSTRSCRPSERLIDAGRSSCKSASIRLAVVLKVSQGLIARS
jgi:hypothetical protein